MLFILAKKHTLRVKKYKVVIGWQMEGKIKTLTLPCSFMDGQCQKEDNKDFKDTGKKKKKSAYNQQWILKYYQLCSSLKITSLFQDVYGLFSR